MNLHGIVRGAITTVNPDISATLKRSTGYTTGANGKRAPTFSSTTGQIQVQGLGPADLRHLQNLNIQGVDRKVYMYGDWGGPIRADQTGGDLLSFPIPRDPNTMRDWKIVTVFETWPDWTAVGVVLQAEVMP